MNYSVISGDIISSTTLQQDDKQLVIASIKKMVIGLEEKFDVFFRLIKGDYIECVVPNANEGLQVMLAIKTYIKTIPIEIENYTQKKKKAQIFKSLGIRLAMGYGPLMAFDREQGVVDGEAIYFSGRLIAGKTTHNKERIVIKNTLFFKAEDEALTAQVQAFLGLLDVLVNQATARQSEVLYLKLMGNNEDTISKALGIDQSVVNRHSTSVGWNAIEQTVRYFSETLIPS